MGHRIALHRRRFSLPHCQRCQPHAHCTFARTLSDTFADVALRAQNLSLSHSIAQFIDQDLKEKVSQPVQAHL